MFTKLHLFSQDAPDGSEEFDWRAHSYLRMAGTVPKGPATFSWSQRQRQDLEELWLNPEADGARDRLASDLMIFAERLGWSLEAKELEEAEGHGEECLLTVSSAAPELYLLPWEVIKVGAAETYFADYSGTLVRYAVPGLEAREVVDTPPTPGVLFAWSMAGGPVPHEEQGAAIRAAAEVGGVSVRELAEVGEASLEAALADAPPSVLHLLCHGLPGSEGEPPRLSWGTSDQRSEVTATRLARMLRRHARAIRLVVLSACGSGDGQQDPLFLHSLAQELHKKGIASVVASRYPLSVRGSRILVKELYDKLLREAWSLERALRHTRSVLFQTDAEGHSHPGDAYGLQLYSCESERFVSANGVEAERPILASYPFGTAERPVPASAPPRKDVELELADGSEPGNDEEHLRSLLARYSEDPSIRHALERAAQGKLVLRIETTVDGAQRLLASWRSGALALGLGIGLGSVLVAKALKPPLAFGAEAAAPSAGQKTAKQTAQQGAVTAGAATAGAATAGAATAGATTAGTAAQTATPQAAAPQAAATQVGAMGTKLGAAKILAIAVASTAVLAGGTVLYQSQSTPHEPAPYTNTEQAAIGQDAIGQDAIGQDAQPDAPDATSTSPDAQLAPAVSPTPPPGALDGTVAPAASSPPATRGQPQAPVARTMQPDAGPPVPAKAAPAAADTAAAPDAGAMPSPTEPSTAPAPLALGPVTLKPDETTYERAHTRVRVHWSLPENARGALVVEPTQGSLQGSPQSGRVYTQGKTWWYQKPARIYVFDATTTVHDWSVQPGKAITLGFWAFDDKYRYSAKMTTFHFEAPLEASP